MKMQERIFLFLSIYCYLSIAPLVASCNNGPNVLPLSLLTFITGISLVSFVSHHVTTTLFASEPISTLVDCASVVLLRLILSPNVLPQSVDALNSTSSFPVLLLHHETQTLSPEISTGAFLVRSPVCTKPNTGCSNPLTIMATATKAISFIAYQRNDAIYKQGVQDQTVHTLEKTIDRKYWNVRFKSAV